MGALLIAPAQHSWMIPCDQRARLMRATSESEKPAASWRLSTKRDVWTSPGVHAASLQAMHMHGPYGTCMYHSMIAGQVAAMPGSFHKSLHTATSSQRLV